MKNKTVAGFEAIGIAITCHCIGIATKHETLKKNIAKYGGFLQ